MTRRGWLGGTVVAAVCAFAVVGCGKHSDPWPTESEGKLRVLASFPPIYCFATNVAGDDAVVLPLLDNVGVHDYHPTPHDAIKLTRANLFLVNGLDLDDGFAGVLANNVGNRKDIKVVPVGEAVPAGPGGLIEAAAHDHDHGHGHSHAHGKYDPHIWLGIPEAIEMVMLIQNKLTEADPAHAAGYAKRAEAYIKKLEKLQDEGVKQFAKAKDRKIITLHDSLRYFARGFKLDVVDFIQPSAGEDVSARRLKKIVDTCVKENVRVIVTEPGQMTSSEVDELLKALQAKGVKGAAKVEFDMMESAPAAELRKDPAYYEATMKQNIKKLAEALAK